MIRNKGDKGAFEATGGRWTNTVGTLCDDGGWIIQLDNSHQPHDTHPTADTQRDGNNSSFYLESANWKGELLRREWGREKGIKLLAAVEKEGDILCSTLKQAPQQKNLNACRNIEKYNNSKERKYNIFFIEYVRQFSMTASNLE